MMRQLKMLLRELVLSASLLWLALKGRRQRTRTALIIGNAAYSFAPLKNPLNDVEAMTKALEGAGFEVIKETDADQAKMVAAVRYTRKL
jgi:Caspase domain